MVPSCPSLIFLDGSRISRKYSPAFLVFLENLDVVLLVTIDCYIVHCFF